MLNYLWAFMMVAGVLGTLEGYVYHYLNHPDLLDRFFRLFAGLGQYVKHYLIELTFYRYRYGGGRRYRGIGERNDPYRAG